MAKKSAKKSEKLPTPKSLAEAAQYEHQIGVLLRAMSIRSTRLERAKQALEQEAESALAGMRAMVLEHSKALHAYASANRDTLTELEKRKTAELPGAGTIRWYLTPPAVEFDKEQEEGLINKLTSLGLTRFVRVKKSIDKELLSKEPEVIETLDGFSLTQKEKFVIEPSGTVARVECTHGAKKTWKIVTKDDETLAP